MRKLYYKLELDISADCGADGTYTEAMIDEVAMKLAYMRAELLRARCDDILSKFSDGTTGIQGFWRKYANA